MRFAVGWSEVEILVRAIRSFALGFVAALLLAAVFLGGYLLGSGRSGSAAARGSTFDLLWQVQDLLQTDFLGEIPNTTAQTYGAIRGLVATYQDPYTVFVEPAAGEVEQDELRGHFGGIGAQLGRDESGNMVLTVMRDRPAALAGLADGDILVAVDGKTISSEMTVEEVIALIRGDIGTSVVLTVSRTGRPEPLDVTIVRERIDTPSVEWRVLDSEQRIGYIRITIFAESTAGDIQTAVEELAAQGVDKVVLDLRGNGGGLLDAAVDTTGFFLRDGDVLREVKRGGQERYYPTKKTQSAAQNWEIALLVDGGTASASEIVAGALRDNGRAVLIGQKTFGKGSVQEVHTLPDGSSLHITVARWLTPDRHQIDKEGLEPDIPVTVSADDRDAGRDPQLKRAQSWLEGEH
jgi:carboxyl-terminal processing protease